MSYDRVLCVAREACSQGWVGESFVKRIAFFRALWHLFTGFCLHHCGRIAANAWSLECLLWGLMGTQLTALGSVVLFRCGYTKDNEIEVPSGKPEHKAVSGSLFQARSRSQCSLAWVLWLPLRILPLRFSH